ncbi:unnamed protein product, partial [Arabidopsis lyrata]
KRLKTTPM